MAAHDSTEFEPTLTDFSRYLLAKVGSRPTTVANIISSAHRFFPSIGIKPTEEECQRYIADMAQRNVSQSHLSNTSVAIEHYMRFIGTPIRLGRQTKPNKTIRGVLSEEEIGRLIGAAKSLRDRTILVLLAYSGIRNNELCTLQVGDVDLSNGHINVRGTKIARDRVIMMPDPCVHVLAKYMEEQDGNQSDPLFVTKRNGNVFEQQDLRKLVRVCAERAGIKKRVYPHLIRHSLATNLMHSGTGLLAIKQQMGHVHLGTTMRYLHADPERMRREYLLHAPNYLPSDD